MGEILGGVMETNDGKTVDGSFGIGRLERSESEHVVEHFRLAGQNADVKPEQSAAGRVGDLSCARHGWGTHSSHRKITFPSSK